MASMSSMLMSESNLRAAAGGFIGAKTGNLVALASELPVFGLVNHPYQPPGNPAPPTVNRPMAITQIRMKFVAATAYTLGGFAFELHKTNVTTNYTDGEQVFAERKKVSGYVAIPGSEIDVRIANTAALTGGDHTIQGSSADAPFDMTVGQGTFPTCDSIWWPEDGIPLVLEANEGLIAHNVITQVGGTGIFFIGIDFFRF